MLIDGKQLKFLADLSLNGFKIINLADPTNPQDAATKAYVDGIVGVGPVPTSANKNMVASVTTADNQVATATPITFTPSQDGYVEVNVNGAQQVLGDGVKTQDSYFSADGGVTAKLIINIAAGDILYWNGSIAGFELAVTDRIDFNYNV